jgi:hypothetical protein
MARPIIGWVEQDVFTRARKYYYYTQRPGFCKWVKNKANRRDRRNAKLEILEQLDEYYN